MAKQAKSLLAQAFFVGSVVLGSGLGASLFGSPAQAAATSFSCGTSKGVPATIATTQDGRQVPMIRWTSNAFEGSGWTPERRCQDVSQRFETYRRQGRLAYITTGRIKGISVICTATRPKGECDGLLYTLKPSQDPTQALQNLLDVRTKARAPLNETNDHLYVSMDELFASKLEEIYALSPVNPTTVGEQGVGILW